MKTTHFALVLLGVATAVVQSKLCIVPNVGIGACVNATTCRTRRGTSHSGYCSGGAEDSCCTGISCGNAGLCMHKNLCKGTAKAGLCPGAESYVCCESDLSSPANSAAGIVAAAESMVGRYPYSWGGGGDYGATYGTKQPIEPYCDDSGVIGFDCSGLAKYAVFQGTGISTSHGAQEQYDDAPKVSLESRQAGDLVFYGSSESKITHVAIYVGNDRIIEVNGHDSECKGIPVRRTILYTGNLISKVGRYW